MRSQNSGRSAKARANTSAAMAAERGDAASSPACRARAQSRQASAVSSRESAKVARVVLEVAGMAEPPLRLILGSEAYAYATAAARARAEADAAWHHLTVSTDRD